MSNGVLSYNDLSAFAVRSGGKLDFEATVSKFSERLMEFDAACSHEDEAIAAAVNNTFDTRIAPGGSLNMDAIVSFSIGALNPNAENFKILSDRIKDWVRSNADLHEKKADDGTVLVAAEAPRTRLFYIARGKGGGCRRWSDIPVKS